MIKVKRLEVGQLKTNCYLATDVKSKKTLIIDPGDDADLIIQTISDERTKPTKIIATHGHFDHVMAAYELQLAYRIPFLINQRDEFLLNNMRSSAKYFLSVDPGPPPKIDGYLKRSHVSAGEHVFKVLETPGHTPGSVSLYDKEEKVLFSGDLIFEGGAVGRTDFKYSNHEDLENSIKKLSSLSDNTRVLAGHGKSFKLKSYILK